MCFTQQSKSEHSYSGGQYTGDGGNRNTPKVKHGEIRMTLWFSYGSFSAIEPLPLSYMYINMFHVNMPREAMWFSYLTMLKSIKPFKACFINMFHVLIIILIKEL